MNPFALMRQFHKLTFNFRVNDEFWHTSDVEHMLRDLQPVFKRGWKLNQCIRKEDQIEVHVTRTCTAWRAFMQPYPVEKERD